PWFCSDRQRRVLRRRAPKLVRFPTVLLRHVQRLVPGKCRNGLDGDAGLGCSRVHANASAVPAELRRLCACGFARIAAGLEVAGDAHLERQTNAAIPEPSADMATLLDRSEQRISWANPRDKDPALKRGNEARVVLARDEHGCGFCPRLGAEEHNLNCLTREPQI